jgi:hypothetical protein
MSETLLIAAERSMCAPQQIHLAGAAAAFPAHRERKLLGYAGGVRLQRVVLQPMGVDVPCEWIEQEKVF